MNNENLRNDFLILEQALEKANHAGAFKLHESALISKTFVKVIEQLGLNLPPKELVENEKKPSLPKQKVG